MENKAKLQWDLTKRKFSEPVSRMSITDCCLLCPCFRTQLSMPLMSAGRSPAVPYLHTPSGIIFLYQHFYSIDRFMLPQSFHWKNKNPANLPLREARDRRKLSALRMKRLWRKKHCFSVPALEVSPEAVLPFISSPQRLEQPELFAVSPQRPLLPWAELQPASSSDVTLVDWNDIEVKDFLIFSRLFFPLPFYLILMWIRKPLM